MERILNLECRKKAIGQKLKSIRPKPFRQGCGCLPYSDIGAYNPFSPLLNRELLPGDEIIQAKQESFLEPYVQLKLDL